MTVVTHFAVLPIAVAALDPQATAGSGGKINPRERGRRRTGSTQAVKRVSLPADVDDSAILGTPPPRPLAPPSTAANDGADVYSENDLVAVLRVVYGAPAAIDITTFLGSTAPTRYAIDTTVGGGGGVHHIQC